MQPNNRLFGVLKKLAVDLLDIAEGVVAGVSFVSIFFQAHERVDVAMAVLFTVIVTGWAFLTIRALRNAVRAMLNAGATIYDVIGLKLIDWSLIFVFTGFAAYNVISIYASIALRERVVPSQTRSTLVDVGAGRCAEYLKPEFAGGADHVRDAVAKPVANGSEMQVRNGVSSPDEPSKTS